MLPLKTAMLLSAGLGTRLRPLTESCPKPLVQAANKPLIDWHLERFVQLGITRVVINVGYLGELIQEHVGDGSRYGLDVVYSVEKNGPLGVMQGLQQAKKLLVNGSFLLVSADTWFQFDLLAMCVNTTADAHFVMVENTAPHKGDFSIDASGKLCDADDKKTYAGVARLLVEDLPDESIEFSAFIRSLIQKKRAAASLYQGNYFNVSTTACLERLSVYLEGSAKRSSSTTTESMRSSE